jgi:subfamily B ATP-binding cassette protein MsbA
MKFNMKLTSILTMLGNSEHERQNLSRLLKTIWSHKSKLLIALVGIVGTAVSEPMFAAGMKILMDKAFVGQASKYLWLAPLSLIGLMLMRGVSTYVSSYSLSSISARVLYDIRQQMFDKMLLLPVKYHQKHPSSQILSKFLLDANNALGLATEVFITLFRDIITVLGLIGYLLYLNWQLALIITIIFPALGLLSRKYRAKMRSINKELQTKTEEMAHVLQETYDAHKVVKLFSGQARAQGLFERVTGEFLTQTKRAARAATANAPVTQLIASIALALVIFITLLQNQNGDTTAGGFVGFMFAMVLLLPPLKNLSNVGAPLQRMLTAADNVFALIDEPAERDVGTHQVVRASGALSFNQVSLTYEGQETPALNQFSLNIKAGEKVALVGRSGSGKTSLINLLARFLDPNSGSIALDGVLLADYQLANLREHLSLVSQDVILFNDSLFNNVAYGAPRASEFEVEAALRAANLWEFVEKQPEHWHVNIGNNGNKLSGGQRQRVAIARAILKDAPILILDEATSALDNESERLVQQALERLMHDRTTLMIAHRLSTIEQADRIVVMENGCIIEVGNHAELLLKKGAYAHLHQRPSELA